MICQRLPTTTKTNKQTNKQSLGTCMIVSARLVYKDHKNSNNQILLWVVEFDLVINLLLIYALKVVQQYYYHLVFKTFHLHIWASNFTWCPKLTYLLYLNIQESWYTSPVSLQCYNHNWVLWLSGKTAACFCVGKSVAQVLILSWEASIQLALSWMTPHKLVLQAMKT